MLVYERKLENKRLLVVVNFDKDEHEINLPFKAKKIILSNYLNSDLSLHKVMLRPYESMIFEL